MLFGGLSGPIHFTKVVVPSGYGAYPYKIVNVGIRSRPNPIDVFMGCTMLAVLLWKLRFVPGRHRARSSLAQSARKNYPPMDANGSFGGTFISRTSWMIPFSRANVVSSVFPLIKRERTSASVSLHRPQIMLANRFSE